MTPAPALSSGRVGTLGSAAMLAFGLCTMTALPFMAQLARAQQAAPPPPQAVSGAEAAAPATAPVAPSAAAPAVQPQTADAEYDVKMRELEGMVSELKEQIFRSKAKLQLLAEQVAGGLGTGAKLVVTHKNELGAAFLIKEVSYYLDGQPLLQEVDESGAKLTEKRVLPVWDGNLVEGSHTLNVVIVLNGNGTGVFKYLSGYKFTLKKSVTFTAEPGKVLAIDVAAFESGNFTTPMEERPALRFDTKTQKETRVDDAKKQAEAVK
jgi:hypothetical protein